MSIQQVDFNGILCNVQNLTKHPIELVNINNSNILGDRKKYYITDGNISFDIKICQEKPLSVPLTDKSMGIPYFSYPEYFDTELNEIKYWNITDVIICSAATEKAFLAKYASSIINNMASPDMYELLDRLYVPIPLYQQDNNSTKSRKKNGSVSLRKSVESRPIEYYYAMLCQHMQPSKIAIAHRLEKMPSYIMYNYNPIMINQLRDYINGRNSYGHYNGLSMSAVNL